MTRAKEGFYISISEQDGNKWKQTSLFILSFPLSSSPVVIHHPDISQDRDVTFAGVATGAYSDARGQAVIISAQIDLHNSRNTNTRRYENTNIQEGNHISTHL